MLLHPSPQYFWALFLALVSQRVREGRSSAVGRGHPCQRDAGTAALLPLCRRWLLDLSRDPFQDCGGQMRPHAGSVNRISVQQPCGSSDIIAADLAPGLVLPMAL